MRSSVVFWHTSEESNVTDFVQLRTLHCTIYILDTPGGYGSGMEEDNRNQGCEKWINTLSIIHQLWIFIEYK